MMALGPSLLGSPLKWWRVRIAGSLNLSSAGKLDQKAGKDPDLDTAHAGLCPSFDPLPVRSILEAKLMR